MYRFAKNARHTTTKRLLAKIQSWWAGKDLLDNLLPMELRPDFKQEDPPSSEWDVAQMKVHAASGGALCSFDAFGRCAVCGVQDTPCEVCLGRGYHYPECTENQPS